MENKNLLAQTNFKTSLKQLEVQVVESNLKKSLVLAMERTGLEFLNIDSTINDIISEFEYTSLFDVIESLRLGSLGKYGKSFRLSTQEVCYWIREYIKENKAKKLTF